MLTTGTGWRVAHRRRVKHGDLVASRIAVPQSQRGPIAVTVPQRLEQARDRQERELSGRTVLEHTKYERWQQAEDGVCAEMDRWGRTQLLEASHSGVDERLLVMGKRTTWVAWVQNYGGMHLTEQNGAARHSHARRQCPCWTRVCAVLARTLWWRHHVDRVVHTDARVQQALDAGTIKLDDASPCLEHGLIHRRRRHHLFTSIHEIRKGCRESAGVPLDCRRGRFFWASRGRRSEQRAERLHHHACVWLWVHHEHLKPTNLGLDVRDVALGIQRLTRRRLLDSDAIRGPPAQPPSPCFFCWIVVAVISIIFNVAGAAAEHLGEEGLRFLRMIVDEVKQCHLMLFEGSKVRADLVLEPGNVAATPALHLSEGAAQLDLRLFPRLRFLVLSIIGRSPIPAPPRRRMMRGRRPVCERILMRQRRTCGCSRHPSANGCNFVFGDLVLDERRRVLEDLNAKCGGSSKVVCIQERDPRARPRTRAAARVQVHPAPLDPFWAAFVRCIPALVILRTMLLDEATDATRCVRAIVLGRAAPIRLWPSGAVPAANEHLPLRDLSRRKVVEFEPMGRLFGGRRRSCAAPQLTIVASLLEERLEKRTRLRSRDARRRNHLGRLLTHRNRRACPALRTISRLLAAVERIHGSLRAIAVGEQLAIEGELEDPARELRRLD